jgi:hypothetical protein
MAKGESIFDLFVHIFKQIRRVCTTTIMTIYYFLLVFLLQGTWFDWFLWSPTFVRKHPIRDVNGFRPMPDGWQKENPAPSPRPPSRNSFRIHPPTHTKKCRFRTFHILTEFLKLPMNECISGRTCKEESLAKILLNFKF